MSAVSTNKRKVLTVFSLVMINIIAVDSLRTLPISAEYGLSLIGFYLVAALVFFIPTALVTAELATALPKTGGIYVWVKEAFGPKWGFLVIWLQWIYNVVWYPTILSFVAAMLAYLIDPKLSENNIYMGSMILILFWGATLINFLGMRVSSWVSTVGSIVGTLLPMILITLLGAYWLWLGKPIHIDFSTAHWFPQIKHLNELVLFSAILYGLVGLEMSAVHAAEVRNPSQDYPRALYISASIILVSLILSSLAVAFVIPQQELSLVAGIMQAFVAFFDALLWLWFVPVLAILMMIGGIASVVTWIIGPTKGLLAVAQNGDLPKLFAATNKQGVPTVILVIQALLVTVLALVYLLMPSVNSSYWLLTELTAQLSLLMYTIMFLAAIALRYKKPELVRPYKIPFGNWGMNIAAGIGFITCCSIIAIGFIPPAQVHIGRVWQYELLLIGGLLLCCLPAWFIHKRKS